MEHPDSAVSPASVDLENLQILKPDIITYLYMSFKGPCVAGEIIESAMSSFSNEESSLNPV